MAIRARQQHKMVIVWQRAAYSSSINSQLCNANTYIVYPLADTKLLSDRLQYRFMRPNRTYEVYIELCAFCFRLFAFVSHIWISCVRTPYSTGNHIKRQPSVMNVVLLRPLSHCCCFFFSFSFFRCCSAVVFHLVNTNLHEHAKAELKLLNGVGLCHGSLLEKRTIELVSEKTLLAAKNSACFHRIHHFFAKLKIRNSYKRRITAHTSSIFMVFVAKFNLYCTTLTWI